MLAKLLYADDIVLLVPDEESLQKMLDFIKEWCHKWRMSINNDKTQVVHFRQPKKSKSDFDFTFGNSSLETVPVYKYLGVMFDEYLTFDINATVLAGAATRALGAIRSKFKDLKQCGFKTFNTLFNSGVLTISDYSAAIWATKCFPKIEQVSYKAARYFLGVHRFAPVDALLGDMGWLSARNRHKLLILNFWNRLCDLPNSRLTRKVFDWDRKFSNIRGTWAYAVKQILIDINCRDLFDDASPCNTDLAKNVIENLDDHEWDYNRYNSVKLRYYNLYKYEKGPEDYLLLDVSKYQRSIFSQFRYGILPLQIEVGRYRDVPLANRTCQICNLEVEDEIRFLLVCNKYSEQRNILFDKAMESDEFFYFKDEIEQFVFLVSNLQKAVMKFLTSALAIRTSILNKIIEN